MHHRLYPCIDGIWLCEIIERCWLIDYLFGRLNDDWSSLMVNCLLSYTQINQIGMKV